MAMTHRGSVGFVYVARARGAIKIGFTTDIERRIGQLGGELIASAPGSFIQEQHLVRTLAAYRSNRPILRGREWFTDEVLEPLTAAWSLMFDAQVAA